MQLDLPLYNALEKYLKCLVSAGTDRSCLNLTIPMPDFINTIDMLPEIPKADIRLPIIAGFLTNPALVEPSINLLQYP